MLSCEVVLVCGGADMLLLVVAVVVIVVAVVLPPILRQQQQQQHHLLLHPPPPPDTADMDSEPKYLSFPYGETTVDVYNPFYKLLGQHDVGGTLYNDACVQGSIAAMAVYSPHRGVHLMNVKTFNVFFKYILPYGNNARLALSKDTLTLGVGSSTGVCVCV